MVQMFCYCVALILLPEGIWTCDLSIYKILVTALLSILIICVVCFVYFGNMFAVA